MSYITDCHLGPARTLPHGLLILSQLSRRQLDSNAVETFTSKAKHPRCGVAALAEAHRAHHRVAERQRGARPSLASVLGNQRKVSAAGAEAEANVTSARKLHKGGQQVSGHMPAQQMQQTVIRTAVATSVTEDMDRQGIHPVTAVAVRTAPVSKGRGAVLSIGQQNLIISGGVPQERKDVTE